MMTYEEPIRGGADRPGDGPGGPQQYQILNRAQHCLAESRRRLAQGRTRVARSRQALERSTPALHGTTDPGNTERKH